MIWHKVKALAHNFDDESHVHLQYVGLTVCLRLHGPVWVRQIYDVEVDPGFSFDFKKR